MPGTGMPTLGVSRNMSLLSSVTSAIRARTLLNCAPPHLSGSTMAFSTRVHLRQSWSNSSKGVSSLFVASCRNINASGSTRPLPLGFFSSRMIHTHTTALGFQTKAQILQSGHQRLCGQQPNLSGTMPGTRLMSSLISAGRPQFRNFNLFNSSKPVVYSIMAVNVAIFGIWQYADGNATRFRDGRLLRFMFQNFTDSAQNLKEGRVWTLITSTFSHRDWYHILLNMMVLMSFGDPVWRLLGTGRFMVVYLGSGVASSLASIFYYQSLEPYLRRQQNKPMSNTIHFSLGASGSIMGITTAFACVYPTAQYSLFFVLTMPAAALIGLFGAYELYNVLATNTGRFDSAGHLGGGLFGAAYYLTRLRPYLRRVR